MTALMLLARSAIRYSLSQSGFDFEEIFQHVSLALFTLSGKLSAGNSVISVKLNGRTKGEDVPSSL
jgi:hypothetical protein